MAAHADWERGTAALYTRLRGRFGDGGGVFANIARPSEEEIIRTSTLLSADQETSRFAFSLPRFKLGSPEGQPGAPPPEADDEAYRYRGPTIAANDVQAVEPLIQLVGRFLPKSEDLARRARIIPGHVVDASFEAKEFTHYVLVGSRSHDFSRSKLPQYSRDFAFEFTECGPWRLIDRREGIFYDVANPALAAAPTPNASDYALVEKIVDPQNDRVLLVIAGMWSSSTLAAGRYLFDKRDEIVRRFGAGGFQFVLETRQGTSEVTRVVVSREPLLVSG